MGGYAWVTLATNDSYSLGALVLAHSLRQVGTNQDLVILITPGVTQSMRDKLSSVFNLVQEVNILDSKDEANLRLIKRPELGVTFTKLHCWRLTQYEKCVFLDADTLVLQNCDELFEREELSAAPDVGWPDCFNSGVFVYKPSTETYEKLIQFAVEKGSFDGGDQGLLNLFFSDWATKDLSKHLPFIYNMVSSAVYSYLPAFKQYGSNAKIIHFLAGSKPWLQYFNTETRKVHPADNLKHLEVVLQKWWDIFCNLIHPNLTNDMAQNRSTRDVKRTNQPQNTSVPNQPATPDKNDDEVWDPWDEYDRKQSIPIINPLSVDKPCESHNTNACDIVSHQVPEQSNDPICDTNHPRVPSPEPFVIDSLEENPTTYDYVECIPVSSIPVVVELIPKVPPVLPIECEPTDPTVCKEINETTLHSPNEDKPEHGGLAGAFAQLTLGAPRTAEQTALDDHLRRQGWEVGNIDYLGRDSFDNIWTKICETLSAAAPPPPPAKEKTPPVIQPQDPIPPVAEAPIAQESVCALTSPASDPAPVPAPAPIAVPDAGPAPAPVSVPAPVLDALISSQAPSPDSEVAAPPAAIPSSEPVAVAPSQPEVQSELVCPKPPASAPEVPKPEIQSPQPQSQAPESPAPQAQALQPAAEAHPSPAPLSEVPAPEALHSDAPQSPPPQAPQSPASQAQAPQSPVPQAPQSPAPQAQAPQSPAPQSQAAQSPAPESQVPQLPGVESQVPQLPVPEVPAPQSPSPPSPIVAAAVPQVPAVEPSSPGAPKSVPPESPVPQSPPQSPAAIQPKAPQSPAGGKPQTPPQSPAVAEGGKPKLSGKEQDAPGSGASSGASPTPPPRKGSGGGAKKQTKPKK